MCHMGNFQKALDFVLLAEGGYVNNIHDPGGATNRGITIQTLSDWAGESCTAEDIRNLSYEETEQIYQHKYWLPINGDSLPQGVALCCFDAAVNSGVNHAAKWLQAVVGAVPDGNIGPATISAVNAKPSGEIINDLLNIRMAFMQSLPTWKNFGAGWSNRLAALRLEAFK